MAAEEVKAQIAKVVLSRTAPMLVQSILDNRGFRDEYRLRMGKTIVFKDHGIRVPRRELYESVSRASRGSEGLTILDTDQHEWLVKCRSDEEKREVFTISREGTCIVLPKFLGLSSDTAVRIKELDEVADMVNLPTRDSWVRVMQERALDEDGVEALYSDLSDTPMYFARVIREEIGTGRVDIGNLVARSRRFYERLVGVYDGSSTIREYSVNVLHELFEGLIGWRSADGLMLCLLLSSDPEVTRKIGEVEVSREALRQVLERLECYGDRYSQIGGIECGLMSPGDDIDIEPVLGRMVAQIVEEKPGEETIRLRLFWMLFRIVDGELLRRRLFAEEAPFYRRLASWAHAALVTQQVLVAGEDVKSFCEWVGGLPNADFFWGNYADMRREPRWSPDFWDGGQARGDCLIRLMGVGIEAGGNAGDQRLVSLRGNSGEGGDVRASWQADRSFVPYRANPVAGSHQMAREMVGEVAEAIEDGLERAPTDMKFLAALVNGACIFGVESSWAEKAAVVLERHCGEAFAGNDGMLVNGMLKGLAVVAAVARSDVLARAVWAGCGRCLVEPELPMSIEEAVRICVTAAASREEVGEWRVFVGKCLTELAFGDLSHEDCRGLLSYMGYLTDFVPELWINCGGAEAALRAYAGTDEAS